MRSLFRSSVYLRNAYTIVCYNGWKEYNIFYKAGILSVKSILLIYLSSFKEVFRLPQKVEKM